MRTRDAANLRWAADPSRLMLGEQPESPYPEDAFHWVSVYRDLVAFNRQVMEAISQRLQTMHSSEGPERPDLELLEAHLDRLLWRLKFWEDRVGELDNDSTTDGIAPRLTGL